MSLSAIAASITIFVQKNLIAALVIAAVLLYLLWRRPRLLLVILLIAALIAGVFYLSVHLMSSARLAI